MDVLVRICGRMAPLSVNDSALSRRKRDKDNVIDNAKGEKSWVFSDAFRCEIMLRFRYQSLSVLNCLCAGFLCICDSFCLYAFGKKMYDKSK